MQQRVKSEIHQLKSDNEEFRKSLQYTQAELCDIKSTIREQDRQGDNLAVGREFSKRVRNLEAELGSATLKCSGATATCSKCNERYRYTL